MNQEGRSSDESLRDPHAFKAFYAETLPKVYGYFFTRCGGERSVAEDLTQETFMSAVKEIRKGAGVEAPTPWILGIARHKLIDHYRRREREDRKLTAISQEAVTEDVLWDGDGSRERALAALGKVPGPQRAALVLRYIDGMSVQEVADSLGKSVHATESLLARGRNSFRFIFEEATDA